jgi:hypothetical protein
MLLPHQSGGEEQCNAACSSARQCRAPVPVFIVSPNAVVSSEVTVVDATPAPARR